MQRSGPWTRRGAAALVLLLLTTGQDLPADEAKQPGGVLVCFEVAALAKDYSRTGDVDIHAERIPLQGGKSWGRKSRGAVLAGSRLVEGRPAACPDGAGGAIVAYTKEFAPDAVDIAVQRIGPDGKRKWLKDDYAPFVSRLKGVESDPVVVSDGRGGAIVACAWRPPGKYTVVNAQRVDAKGRSLWEPDKGGLFVAGARSLHGPPVAVSDGVGGVIIVYAGKMRDEDTHIYAQRVTKDGKVLWNEGEVPTAVARSAHDERRPAAIPDGRGGVIVVFELEFRSGPFKGDVSIFAQRISAEGKLLWGTSRRPAIVSGRKSREGRPTAVSDGAEGLLVAFEYERTTGDAAGDIDVLAQRLTADGKRAWPEATTAVASSPATERAPTAVAMDDGGMVVAFEYEPRSGPRAGNCDIVAQRLGPDGVRRWNEGKRSSAVQTRSYREHSPRIVADGRGGVVIVASADVPPSFGFPGLVGIRAQRLDGNGRRTWSDVRLETIGAAMGPDLRVCAILLVER